MSFGQAGPKQPEDHKPRAASAADRIQALDVRRQAQIQNQIASINRLLVDGTYDHEMSVLHNELAERRASAERALAELATARAETTNKFVLARLDAVEEALRSGS